jgi:spermidine synthase
VTPTIVLTVTAFFISGFAALLYQVIWQRLLAIFSGADIYSATVIVAAFMGGLGIGNLAGGVAADRVSRKTSLILFAVAETAVAIFGALSAWLYYDVLYAQLGATGLGRGPVAAILFASLLWPTFFMGASLPLLARAVTDRMERAATNIGALYGFNTLGAACGAAVATWVLLPSLGLDGSLRVGAALNVICAVMVLPLAGRMQSAATTAKGRSPSVVEAGASRLGDHSFAFWLLIYAFAGFIALSYEIVWFRLLGVIAKSTAFTFGTLLTLYLAGIGLGAVAGSVLATRVRHPARAFFTIQAAAGVAAAVLIALFVGLADNIGALSDYFAGYEPLNIRDAVATLRSGDAPGNFIRFYIAVPMILVVPPTLLMGCAFPILQRVVQDDAHRLGRRVGGLLLANIAGSIAGTIVTGGWLLGLFGAAGTLRLLALTGTVFIWFAIRPAGRVPAMAAVAATIALAIAMPSAQTLWSRLHGSTPDRVVIAEDSSGVSVITAGSRDFLGRKVVFVNGVGQSVLPYGDIHTALGALPVLVHPAPADVAIIGLGSGDTVYAAAGRPETSRIICVEIIGAQIQTLRALAGRDVYAGLRGLLNDPRIEHVTGDGRAFLLRSMQKFDVIEADALRPTSAYSGNLYSEAYFLLVRIRL